MTIELVNEIPDIPKRLSLKYREIVNVIRDSEVNKVYKFITDDGKTVNSSSTRLMLEQRTGRVVTVQRFDKRTLYIKVLNKEDKQKEFEERKVRAIEMKKKLGGKKKGE